MGLGGSGGHDLQPKFPGLVDFLLEQHREGLVLAQRLVGGEQFLPAADAGEVEHLPLVEGFLIGHGQQPLVPLAGGRIPGHPGALLFRPPQHPLHPLGHGVHQGGDARLAKHLPGPGHAGAWQKLAQQSLPALPPADEGPIVDDNRQALGQAPGHHVRRVLGAGRGIGEGHPLLHQAVQHPDGKRRTGPPAG